MKRSGLATLLLALCGPLPPLAAQVGPATTPTVFSETCEVDLALSAAPEHLRADAGVYAYRDDGYALVRASTNGFTCIVNRDHPNALKPTCFDAEGTATIIPKIVRFGELLSRGTPVDRIQQEIAAGFTDGTYQAPGRSGVAYMLSAYNRPLTNAATGETGSFPPHVMYYAPGLTNEDIGVSWEARRSNPSLPFIAYQGPHGFIIAVEEDYTPAPVSSCDGWLE